jgi:MarR family transcriptional regulator, organic hydroperoxide resistance regulator
MAETALTKRSYATPAHEAQALFFELGMKQKMRSGAVLAEHGLTFPQAHALRLLDPERPLPMSHLADNLFCDASNVTGLADRLEARGLVERRPGEEDRRQKMLALTAAGARVRKAVLDAMSDPPDEIAALPLRDQRTLRDILRRAVERLRETEGASGQR